MNDAKFFMHPIHDWQRRYEALRASFVERLPGRIVAERFGYSQDYVRLLRHLFKRGKIDFSEPVPEGKSARRQVSSSVREKIRNWREQRLSAGEITECLSEDGIEISVRTVERVLREEGFAKLPRRTRLKMGMTVKGAHIPEKSKAITVGDMDGQKIQSPSAGIFVFAPFLAQLEIDRIVRSAGLPSYELFAFFFGHETLRNRKICTCRGSRLRSRCRPFYGTQCGSEVYSHVYLFLLAG